MHRIAAASLALAASACSFVNDPTHLKPEALDSATGFCAALGAARPDWVERCWGLDATFMADQVMPWDATCGDMQVAWEAGRVTYHREKAAACIAAWTYDGACNRPNRGFETCGEVFGGAVAAGGACYDGRDCAAGAECVHAAYTCPGICTPPGTAGDSCSSTASGVALAARCGGGYYCDGTSGTCAPKKTATSVPNGCADAGECAGGHVCAGPAGARTCQAIPGATEPCDDAIGLGCADHFACQAGACAAAPAVGPCLAGLCAAGSTCTAGTCAPVPGLGETCTFDVGCREGQGYCSSTTHTCLPSTTRLAAEGEECAAGHGCVDGLFCDQATSPFVCRPFPPIGGACSPSTPCSAGNHCVAGRCAPFRRAGESCTTGMSDCLDGLYCAVPFRCGNGGCTGTLTGTCATLPGPGADCGALPDGETVECRRSDAWCDKGGSSFGTCQALYPSGHACNPADARACGPSTLAICQLPSPSATQGTCASTCRER